MSQWERQNLKRTLLVEDYGKVDSSGKHKYAIFPFIRVTTQSGETALEPLPAFTGTFKVGFFDAIEFVPPSTTARGMNTGDLALCNSGQIRDVHPDTKASVAGGTAA